MKTQFIVGARKVFEIYAISEKEIAPATRLIINKFFSKIYYPKFLLLFLFKRSFYKGIKSKKYIDVVAMSQNNLVGVMRAKLTKNIWDINTNCTDEEFTRNNPTLWLRMVLYLAECALINNSNVVITFQAQNLAINKTGLWYALRHGIKCELIEKSNANNKFTYKISRNS